MWDRIQNKMQNISSWKLCCSQPLSACTTGLSQGTTGWVLGDRGTQSYCQHVEQCHNLLKKAASTCCEGRRGSFLARLLSLLMSLVSEVNHSSNGFTWFYSSSRKVSNPVVRHGSTGQIASSLRSWLVNFKCVLLMTRVVAPARSFRSARQLLAVPLDLVRWLA